MSAVSSQQPVPQVVIIGAGFAGLAVAKGLAGLNCRVTLLDKRNFHLFQPLLYQVATGSLSPAQIATPIRALVKRAKNVTVLLGEVTAIDAKAHTVTLASGAVLPFDLLVVAPGVRTQYFNHPEWEALAPGLKTLEDALTIRSRVLAAFEHAETARNADAVQQALTFVVVGGGPTGVELAGAIAEIATVTLRGEYRHINPATAHIMLVEGGPSILPMYVPKLRERATRDLIKLGVDVRTDTMVTALSPEGVTLSRAGASEFIPSCAVVWGAGIRAAPWTADLAAQTGTEIDKLGRLVVNPDLTLPGQPEIFVAGDLAHCKGPDGQPLPALGSVAQQQGHYLKAAIRRRLDGRGSAPAFRYRDRGTMATIGRSAAIADFHFVRLTGLLGWLAWLFVHLMLLVEFRSRLTVFFVWAWSYFSRNRYARLITGEGSQSSGPP